MRFTDEFLQELKDRNDILDVVESYIPLKKKGSNYWGLCPFHNEKTPSFSVYPPKRMFHCFGCGEGGDVITFVMKYENATYPEAVKILAERSGMEIVEKEDNGEGRARRARADILREINKDAATFYVNALYTPHGEKGLKYFKDRGLTDETIKHFGLGYSGTGGKEVVDFLRGKGYSDEMIIASGIANNSETYGMSSPFFSRVMFPIINTDKKVIGFGGRVLGSGEPKYLNTKETEIFDKRRNLYGYNFAKRSRKKYYILCEGYMDVISMHQAGFDSAMASLGTAFTEEQATIIKRDRVEDVYLAYDMDEAGEKAAVRAVRLLAAVGITPKRINMKPCKDPDEFITKNGVEEFEKRLSSAENGFLYIEDRIRDRYNHDDPEERYKCQKETVENLWIFGGDQVKMNSYAESISDRYGYPKSEISKLLEETKPREIKDEETPKARAYSPPKKASGRTAEKSFVQAESTLLTWITDEPGLLDVVKKYIGAGDFSPGVCRELAGRIYDMIEDGDFNADKLLESIEDEEVKNEAIGIILNPAPGIDTAEKRLEMLKDLIVSVLERKCELLTSSEDAEKDLKIYYLRQEIDRLKSGKLDLSKEEQ